MSTTTVRISAKSHQVLRELSTQQGRPMQMILEQALEEYRRRCVLDAVNAAYAALRHDPAAWAAVQQERVVWDATLGDGLPQEEADA